MKQRASQLGGRWLVIGALVTAAVLASAGAAGTGGNLDPSFGAGGKVIVDYGAYEYFESAVVQPDGRILAAGGTSASGGRSNAGLLVRLNPDGSTDTSFGGDGRMITPSIAYRGAVGLQRDGKILFAGGVTNFGGTGMDIALARFNSDGSPDTSFGVSGRVETDIDRRYDMPYQVLQAPDAKIVLVGQTIAGSNSDIVVARYTADGRLDPTFAGDGTLTSDWGNFDVPKGAVVTASGAILVGGFSEDAHGSSGVVVVARYTADGQPDPTFAGDGVLVTENAADNNAGGVAVQPDGKLLLAAGDKFTIRRYLPDGRADPSFGSGGIVVGRFAEHAVARAVAVQPNGKVVVFGSLVPTDGRGDVFTVARLLPGGAADPSFRTDPALAPDLGGGYSGYPEAVALAPDGRIVVAGFAWKGSSDNNGVVVRYQPGTCSVPSVTGNKLTRARARIAAGNCRVGRVQTVASKRVGAGLVVSQSRRAGQEAADWAFVDLVVSRGQK